MPATGGGSEVDMLRTRLGGLTTRWTIYETGLYNTGY